MLLGLWSVVLVLVLVGAARGDSAQQTCTHGLSSLGPVEIVDGKVVGGSTTPQTEACLP
jgi:hypothetical protein